MTKNHASCAVLLLGATLSIASPLGAASAKIVEAVFYLEDLKGFRGGIEITGFAWEGEPVVFADGFESGGVRAVERGDRDFTVSSKAPKERCQELEKGRESGKSLGNGQLEFRGSDGSLYVVKLTEVRVQGGRCDVHPWTNSFVVKDFNIGMPPT